MFVSRRRFLFCFVVASVGFGGSSTTPNPVTSARELFSNDRSVREIRERYIRLYPAEADPEILLAGLERSSPALAATLRSSDQRRLRSRAQAQIRRDFAVNDVVTLDGWLLSRTEVRLATLAAMA
jgi:hypothetical protein